MKAIRAGSGGYCKETDFMRPDEFRKKHPSAIIIGRVKIEPTPATPR
jgi:hypothetical protein